MTLRSRSILVLMIEAAGTCWLAISCSTPSKMGGLTFGSAFLETPVLPVAAEHRQAFSITNTSKVPLSLHRFETSCSCLGVEPRGVVAFEPGETKEFSAVLRADLPDGVEPDEHGEFLRRTDISFVCTGVGGKPQRVSTQLMARIRTPLALNPSTVIIGDRSNRSEAMIVEITVTLSADVATVRFTPHAEWKIEVIGDVLDSQRHLRLRLTAKNSGNLRVIRDGIALIPVMRDGTDGPAQAVKIYGEIVPDLRAVPNAVHAGRLHLGATFTEVVRLESLTHRAFSIAAAAADKGVEIKSVGENEYLVTVVGKALGDQEMHLRFTTADGVLVTVPVRYVGEEHP